MALHRQGSGPWPIGVDPDMNGDHKVTGSQRPASTSRMYDHVKGDQGSVRQGNTSRHNEPTTVIGRGPLKLGKGKRLVHPARGRHCSIGFFVVLLLLVVLITIFGSETISHVRRGEKGSSHLDSFFGNLDNHLRHPKHNANGQHGDFLGHGQLRGFDDKEDKLLRVSRDWDRDDSKQEHVPDRKIEDGVELDVNLDRTSGDSTQSKELSNHESLKREQSAGLYNERGRNELLEYEARFEQQRLLEKNGQQDRSYDGNVNRIETDGLGIESDKAESYDDEYDDDGGEEDVTESDEATARVHHQSGVEETEEHQGKNSGFGNDSEELQSTETDLSRHSGSMDPNDASVHTSGGHSLVTGVGINVPVGNGKGISGVQLGGDASGAQGKERKGDVDLQMEKHETQQVVDPKTKGKKKSKHSSAAPCDINFRSTTEGLEEPEDTSKFAAFSLNYIQREERPEGNTEWEPRFAGHQTLEDREDSFHARNQTLHCGFVQSPQGYAGTGFELNDSDSEYLRTCHIAVSSCIFGNWDHIRSPPSKKMSSSSKKKVCFVMFVDQASLDVILQEGQKVDANGNLGLWRIVLIKNLPYRDGRRNGKVPKFLTHRLFPNARYSIWLDSKLRLQSDPLLILEYFLWRGKHEYAISNHYDRHCVWEEVAQNKRLNKFNHSIIDQQFLFYQKDGLPRFNESDHSRLLPSHVPEGSFIVRAHTPMANLFSCLWFNEVDRFTPRDQLSFAYTYLKLARTNPPRRFRFHMFKDCERKAMAKLYRHRQDVGQDRTGTGHVW